MAASTTEVSATGPKPKTMGLEGVDWEKSIEIFNSSLDELVSNGISHSSFRMLFLNSFKESNRELTEVIRSDIRKIIPFLESKHQIDCLEEVRTYEEMLQKIESGITLSIQQAELATPSTTIDSYFYKGMGTHFGHLFQEHSIILNYYSEAFEDETEEESETRKSGYKRVYRKLLYTLKWVKTY